jgi:hypothetical protein
MKMRMMLGDWVAAASDGFRTGETSDCCDVISNASIAMNSSFFFMTGVDGFKIGQYSQALLT